MSNSRKVVKLFYDVISPYSWLAFEVGNVFSSLVYSLPCLRCKCSVSTVLVLILCFKVLCRYRNVWNIDLKFKPAYLTGVIYGSGNDMITTTK